MTAKRSRLILTKDGERVYSHLTDAFSRVLDDILRVEKIKKKDLALHAGVNESVVSRALDGYRNVELRTLGALLGAAGYTVDLKPRKIRSSGSNGEKHRPKVMPEPITKQENFYLSNDSGQANENVMGPVRAYEGAQS